VQGFNRYHAVLGASESCIAVNPSDMSVALVALGAVVHLRTARGSRQMPLNEFLRLPGNTPQADNHLSPSELITAIDIPPNKFAEHSAYLKLRDRASFAFALVSVAAALDLNDGVVQDVRLVLGGVAHKPWPVPDAGAVLNGRRIEASHIREVAEIAFRGAVPRAHNAFKIELGKRAIVRALGLAASPQEA
jgi:xanthine dehydrogenase YagS FAD-binding subunit